MPGHTTKKSKKKDLICSRKAKAKLVKKTRNKTKKGYVKNRKRMVKMVVVSQLNKSLSHSNLKISRKVQRLIWKLRSRETRSCYKIINERKTKYDAIKIRYSVVKEANGTGNKRKPPRWTRYNPVNYCSTCDNTRYNDGGNSNNKQINKGILKKRSETRSEPRRTGQHSIRSI